MASWRSSASAKTRQRSLLARLRRRTRRSLAGRAPQRERAIICFGVGIALHFGNAAFGNVGSGARLDYTVIGRDVNLAARIADLCGELGEGLLLSDTFQSRLSEQEFRKLGAFSLKGVDEAQTVFAPVGP